MGKLSKQELKTRIQNHEILTLAPEERQSNLKLRLSFCELVMSYRKLDERLESVLSPRYAGRSALAEIEARRFSRKSTDSLSFMRAFESALKNYRLEGGASFLTYFETCYKRVNAETVQDEQPILGQKIVSRQNKLAKKLFKMLQMQWGDVSRAPEEAIERSATAMGISVELCKELVNQRREYINFSVDVCLSEDDENSETLESVIADESVLSPEEVLLRTKGIVWMIEVLLDEDMKEYPRLFLTNSLLAPLKECKDNRSYKQQLQTLEEQLWRCILYPNYCSFLFLEPPTVDTIERMDESDLEHPLINKTIALYKQVSEAAVSKNYTRFRKSMWERRSALLEQQGLS